MSSADWQLVGFSLRMALASLLLVLPPGLALAWWLARKDWRGKALVETLVWLHNTFHFDVVFTWRAVALALAAMSLPLLVRAARTAFEEVDVKFEQLARTLGAGEWRVFFTITLPLARRGVLAGTLLAFARALGEFGATIMVAGNIPGRTTTLPVAIYQAVENGEDAHAWTLAGVSAVIAFAAVFVSEKLQRRRK